MEDPVELNFDPELTDSEELVGSEFTDSEELAAARAHAEAEVQRLRDKEEAVSEASRAAGRGTRMRILRQAAGEWAIDCNRARSRAQEVLEKLAGAPTLNVAKLQAAFIEFKMADARCGSNGDYAGGLDHVDPLPDSPIGAPRTRARIAGQAYAALNWSSYLDNVINERAHAEKSRAFALLQGFEFDQAAAAQAEVRRSVLELDDYERLDVETPPSIAELHEAAVATIDESSFDAERVKAGGLISARRAAHNAELDKLVDAGN